jgi:uncharacterized protein YpmS
MNTLSPLRRCMRLGMTALALLVGPASLVGAQTPEPAPQPDYARMLRELKPTMVFEVTEANLNTYLMTHPEDFAIPDGFDAPRVEFGANEVEVSALKRVLLVTVRVRVAMVPEIMRGRLRLKVSRVSAGPIPLPSNFHAGVADTIERIVNQILEHNNVQLTRVEIVRGLVRVTAQVRPSVPAAPAAGDAS